jgi:hypothetical protein
VGSTISPASVVHFPVSVWQLFGHLEPAGCFAPFAAIHTARCGFRKRTFVQVVAATGAPDPERTIDGEVLTTLCAAGHEVTNTPLTLKISLMPKSPSAESSRWNRLFFLMRRLIRGEAVALASVRDRLPQARWHAPVRITLSLRPMCRRTIARAIFRTVASDRRASVPTVEWGVTSFR